MRRHRMSRRKSRKMFSKSGSRTHKKNLRAVAMRGGYRI